MITEPEADRLAKESMVLRLFQRFPSLASKDQSSINMLVSGYTDGLAEYSVEAVTRACRDFAQGAVEGYNIEYPPTGPQMAARARLWHQALRPKEDSPRLYNGLLSVDFGDGRIDLRGMTAEQQDAVLRNKGIPAQIAAGVTPKLHKLGYTVGDERDD